MNMERKYFAAFNKDDFIRKQSSSGGIFYSLAEYVIKQKGVVFGAIWNKDWLVDITYTETLEGIKPMMTSKYVLANINNSYEDCKRFLDAGRLVLYTSIPCQIHGLKNYLKKEYDNLICVDICCHGTMPVQIWKDYLETIKKPNNSIVSINMRDKEKGWTNYQFVIKYQDGTELKQHHNDNKYMQVFLSDKYLRPCCYDCKFKNAFSKADIMIGDLWSAWRLGINKDNKGISSIITNTDKGKNIIDDLFNLNNIVRYSAIPEQVMFDNGGMRNKIDVQSEVYDKDEVFCSLPKIVLCSVAKNENHYIREWVEHYKNLGFDNIILYDNNDTNGERFESVIKDYLDSGFVILKDVRGKQEAQIFCFNECYQTDAKRYDYIFFCDTDEFLEIDDLDIKHFVSQNKFKQFNAIAVNWQNYDDNDLVTHNENYSVKKFTRLCENQETNFACSCHCNKKILKTKLNVIINSPHAVSIPGEYQTEQSDFYKQQLEQKVQQVIKCCNVNGEACYPSWSNQNWTWNEARIKHYRFKTLEEFINNKIPKGYATAWGKRSGITFLKLENFFKYNKITNAKLLYLKEHENLLSNEDKIWLSKQRIEFKKLRVAINTLPPYNNHGGILQCYALQTILEQLGCEATVVARTKSDMFPFIDKYIHRRPCRIYECNQHDYDVIITGSDQIFRREWAVDAGWKVSSLDWATKWNIKRISYAMSMGTPKWTYTTDETLKLVNNFNTFTSMSVRENDLAKMLTERGIKSVEVMPDPTLLLHKEHYMKLCKDIPVRDNKCFVYLLGFNGQLYDDVLKNPQRLKLIKELKDRFNLDNIEIKRESTEEWLAAFRDAKYIITDSYHGTLFSLIFNKPFICVANETRGNSRFDTIKENYGFKDHFVNSIEDINLDIFNLSFDSTKVVNTQYNKGVSFLKSSLNFNDGLKSYSYISLLSTDDYLPYLLVMNDSLQNTHPVYPLHVLLTSNISEKTKRILNYYKIKYIEDVDDSRVNDFKVKQHQRFSKFTSALNKLRIFDLTQFTKCVYLDCDMLICQNIDDLFSHSDWSAVQDDCVTPSIWRHSFNYYTPGDTLFNSGLFVFSPSKVLYSNIITMLDTLPADCSWHDQTILAYYIQDWLFRKDLHLDSCYNMIYTSYSSTHSFLMTEYDKIKIKHFCLKGICNFDAHPNFISDCNNYRQLVLSKSNIVKSFNETKVAVCSVAKQENNYIREWVEHYRKLGFNRIYLYDNNDVDGERFESVIDDYIKSGFVVIYDVRGLSEAQIQSFNKFYHSEECKLFDWIFFCDIDEFLQLDYSSIQDFVNLKRFTDYNTIEINWKSFDDNNLVTVENNNYSLMNRFTHELDVRQNRENKKIVRTNIPVVNINSAHVFNWGGYLQYANSENVDTKENSMNILKYVKACDVLGNSHKPSTESSCVIHKEAWINHYRYKTIEEYLTNKMPKGYATWYANRGKNFLTIERFFEINEITQKKLDYIQHWAIEHNIKIDYNILCHLADKLKCRAMLPGTFKSYVSAIKQQSHTFTPATQKQVIQQPLTANRTNKVVGIISYLPKTKDINLRIHRLVKLKELLNKIKQIFNLPVMLIAQNYEDHDIKNVLDTYSNMTIYRSEKPLGITGAREYLRQKFIESKYEYIILLDDDSVLAGTNGDKYLQQLDCNPGKMGMFIKSQHKLMAFHKDAYKLLAYDLENTPEKHIAFEDRVYTWTFVGLYPDKVFKFNNTGIGQVSEMTHSATTTWSTGVNSQMLTQMVRNTNNLIEKRTGKDIKSVYALMGYNYNRK